MQATLEDARLLFARWREEAPSLKVTLRSPTLIFQASGRLVDFNPTALQLHGESWQLTIPMEGARFTFSDPREIASQAVRSAEMAKYEFGLAVDLPNGDRVAVMELKSGDIDEDTSDEETA